MLPDIARPNKLLHVSGLGQYAGGGVLSRSYEDLHPCPDQYEVVWNGTIEAQAAKAEQRTAPHEMIQTRADRSKPLADVVVEAIKRAGKPVSVLDMVKRTGLHYGIVDITLRRLALRGELSVCDQLNADLDGIKRKWRRVYSLPKMAKEQAA